MLLKLSTDSDVHRPGRACVACMALEGYPRAHGSGCAGFLHGERRYNLDAGGEQVFTLQRCDGCEHEGFIERERM